MSGLGAELPNQSASRRDECRRDGRLGKICAPTVSRKSTKRRGVKVLFSLFVYNPTGLFAGRRLALFEQSLLALHPILSQSRTAFRGEIDRGCPPRPSPPTRLHSVFGNPGVWLNAVRERGLVVASPR